METLNKAEIENGTEHQVLSRYQIDVNQLSLLHRAISRWDQFLGELFIIPASHNLTADAINLMSLEDTDHYLEVKIQLFQCLTVVQSAELEQKFENICGAIRKITYHQISTNLPRFADNRRGLVELAQKNDRIITDSDVSNLGRMPSPDLGVSQEYKDCLVQERRQLKSDFIRQRSMVKSLIERLKKKVNRRFYSRPGEQ
jgi:hypothetical protein